MYYFYFENKQYDAIKVLELNGDFSEKDVKRQYRLLVKKYHPDNYVSENIEIQKNMNFKLQLINMAYNTLVNNRKDSMFFDDLEKSKEYDNDMDPEIRDLNMKVDIICGLCREKIDLANDLIDDLKKMFNSKMGEREKFFFSQFIVFLCERQDNLIEYYNGLKEKILTKKEKSELEDLHKDGRKFLQNYGLRYSSFIDELFANDIICLSDSFKYVGREDVNYIYLLINASCNLNKLINDVCLKNNIELDNEMKKRLMFNLNSEENLIKFSDLENINPIKSIFLKKKIEKAIKNIFERESHNQRKI